MRKPDKVDPGSQYVLGSLGELKQTELLVTEAITLNSVAVKNAGVRRQNIMVPRLFNLGWSEVPPSLAKKYRISIPPPRAV